MKVIKEEIATSLNLENKIKKMTLEEFVDFSIDTSSLGLILAKMSSSTTRQEEQVRETVLIHLISRKWAGITPNSSITIENALR